MSAICSICGSDMTVQDGEGTAFCLSCENAGLDARIAELEAEATATGPERDLADLELLAREFKTVIEVRRLRLDVIGTRPLPQKYAPDGIAYRLNARDERDPPKLITRAEALALLKEAK
jgi:hypothetical protein